MDFEVIEGRAEGQTEDLLPQTFATTRDKFIKNHPSSCSHAIQFLRKHTVSRRDKINFLTLLMLYYAVLCCTMHCAVFHL